MSEQNNCYIATGTKIKGKIVSNGDLRVDGSIDGTLDTTGRLVVGHSGRINGDLKTGQAEIDGTVNAKTIDSQTLKLNASAHFIGDIKVEKLSVEPGAQIEGTVNVKSFG